MTKEAPAKPFSVLYWQNWRMAFFPQIIQRRHDQQRKEGRVEQTSGNADGQGLKQQALAENHRQQAEKRGGRGQQNRPQSLPAGFPDGFFQPYPVPDLALHKLYQNNAVADHDAGQADHPHQGHKTQRRPGDKKAVQGA